MTTPDYPALEAGLVEILSQLGDTLSGSERQEVEEFVDVGEYGVALETLSFLIVEEEKRISRSTFHSIARLAEQMGISESVVTDKLHQAVV
jgi:exopolysaccharide biosynthesis predicted pyruvyltransferase EpsI